jgi:alpha-beta hydrolase superfamily lysophospholipase
MYGSKVPSEDGMEHTQGTFRGDGGLELYYQCWHPAGEAQGVVVIVHGLGEHSGRYGNVVDQMTGRGYAVYGFDHRGHGRSPGQRGHVNRWQEYRGDVRAFLALSAAQEPERPVFLYGHSIGALIVLDYLIERSNGVRGAIVSAVPLRPVGVAKPHLVALARLLSGIWPRFSVPLPLHNASFSRDPDAAQAAATDPLLHRTASVRWGTESMATIERVEAHADRLRLPLLVIQGRGDRVSSAEGSRILFQQVAYPDKCLKIYPDGYHEPHNDIHYASVLSEVEEWMSAHMT